LITLHSSPKYISRVKVEKNLEVSMNEKLEVNKKEQQLVKAAADGELALVQQLIEQEGVNAATARDEDGYTAAISAAIHGHLHVINYLEEENKANIETRAAANGSTGSTGSTVLMFAAQAGHFNIVRFLAGKQADVDANNEAGWTALMFAARAGHFDIVRFLAGKQADVDANDEAGWTALMFAAIGGEKGHVEIVRFLVGEKKARVNDESKEGDAVLMFAAYSHQKNCETLKYLIEESENPHKIIEQGSGKGITWAMFAIWSQDIEKIQYVLELLKAEALALKFLASEISADGDENKGTTLLYWSLKSASNLELPENVREAANISTVLPVLPVLPLAAARVSILALFSSSR